MKKGLIGLDLSWALSSNSKSSVLKLTLICSLLHIFSGEKKISFFKQCRHVLGFTSRRI